MGVYFNKLFTKNWFTFPLCIVWCDCSCEYGVKSGRLEVHILWWHFGWTFYEKEKDNG